LPELELHPATHGSRAYLAMKLKRRKSVDMTRWDEFVCEFVKFWRQLDDDAKDRVETELRRLLKEEHGSWEVGSA